MAACVHICIWMARVADSDGWRRRHAATAGGDRRRGKSVGSRMLQLVAFTEEKRTEYARVPGDGGWERGEGGMSHWSGGWAETCW